MSEARSAEVSTRTRGPRPCLDEAAPVPEHRNGDFERKAQQFGRPGRRFNRTTPFFIGLTGALGVAVAYGLVRSVADVAQVLTIIGIALFLGVGLQPAVVWLERRRIPRPAAVALITFGFLAVIGAFLAAAIPPITHEAHELMVSIPRYRAEIAEGHGWLGHVVAKLHLSSYVRGNSAASKTLKKEAVGGVIGAGKLLLSTTAAAVSVVVLTVYFLVTLPSVSKLWLGLVPASRHDRVGLLIEEVFGRVGGFVLGNLITSRRRRWHHDLVDHFRSALRLPPRTVRGDLRSHPNCGFDRGGRGRFIALSRGLPVALATAGFYVFYRLFEDYLLVPRVMNRTVRISPGLTIMATLVGAALWGLLGALVAIPIAAGVRLVLEEVVLATDRL